MFLGIHKSLLFIDPKALCIRKNLQFYGNTITFYYLIIQSLREQISLQNVNKVKANIRLFSGFAFEEGSKPYKLKKIALEKLVQFISLVIVKYTLRGLDVGSLNLLVLLIIIKSYII